ncbi:MAG: 30S ribosomal protein S9 [Planctomycetota bacterium]|jgi:small subunit ribosomal protein S9
MKEDPQESTNTVNEQPSHPPAGPDDGAPEPTEPSAQTPETTAGSEPTVPGPSAPTPPADEKPTAPRPATPRPAGTAEGTARKRTKKDPVPVPAPTSPPDGHWWWGIGRRKSAVARVRLCPGDGKFIVNRRPYDKYFTEERDRKDLMNVLNKTNTAGNVDVHVNVRGGGYTGQAGAIVLGLGRAIRRYDETLEPILRDNAFLTRDPRKVERKKYGQPGARRRFQFSKR